jgi:hypothetical protein
MRSLTSFALAATSLRKEIERGNYWEPLGLIIRRDPARLLDRVCNDGLAERRGWRSCRRTTPFRGGDACLGLGLIILVFMPIAASSSITSQLPKIVV